MGYQQTDITAATAVRNTTTGSLTVEAGELQALTIICTTPDTEPCQNYAEIGLIAESAQLTSPFATLARGYLGEGSSVSWTGNITLAPGYQVFARVSSSVAATFRLSALTAKV
jgi:hypothetical protein